MYQSAHRITQLTCRGRRKNLMSRNTSRAAPRSGGPLVRQVFLAASDLDQSIQVHCDPGLFTNLANSDLNFSERGLDRGFAVRIGDGECPTSDESAPANHHTLPGARTTAAPADHDRECSFKKDIFFQRRPVIHPFTSLGAEVGFARMTFRKSNDQLAPAEVNWGNVDFVS